MAKNASPISAKFTFDGKDLEIGLTKAQAKLLDTGNAASALSRILRAQAQAADEAANATGRLGASGHGTVSGMQAASASIRLLENPLGNNIRALERLSTMLPGVSSLFQAAFPIVGAIAAIGVITDLGERLTAAAKKLKDIQEAPQRIKSAFTALQSEQLKTQDDLDVTNAKLRVTLDKLTHTPNNGIALALVEARKRADELSASISQSVSKIEELLVKESIDTISTSHLLYGNQTTTAVSDRVTQAKQDLSDVDYRRNQQTESATSDKAKAQIADAATASAAAIIAELHKWAEQGVRDVKIQIDALKAQDHFHLDSRGNLHFSNVNVHEYDAVLADYQGVANDTFSTAQLVKSSKTNQDLQTGVDKAQADKNRLEALKPLKEVQEELDKAVTAANGKLAAQRAALEAATPAQAEYAKAVGMAEERNKELTESLSNKLENARHGTKLSDAQTAQLAGVKNTDILTAQAKLQETINIENQKALDMGNEKLAASERALTVQFASNAVRREEAGNAAVAAAYEKDADLNGTVADEIRMRALETYDNKVKESTNQQLHDIALQIAAQRNLNAARLQGADAIRNAQLRNRFGEIDSDSGTTDQQKQALKDAASLQSQMSQSASVTTPWIIGAKDQLDTLNRTIEALKTINASEESLKEIEMERGKLLDEMALKMDDIGVGLHVALSQMADDVQTSAKIARDSLMQLQSGVNDNLAKALTGQKTGWAKMFQSDGESLIKKGLGNLEGTALKSLGFGAKADGSSSSPFYVKVVGGIGGGGAQAPSWIPGGLTTADGLDLGGGTTQQGLQGLSGGGSGGFSGIFSTILKSLFAGFHADGGTIGAGQWGIVGEQGPEAAYGGTTGLSISNGKGGSGQITYQIDARGADAAQVEARVARAIAMSHQSSVSQALAATKERALRRPRGT